MILRLVTWRCLGLKSERIYPIPQRRIKLCLCGMPGLIFEFLVGIKDMLGLITRKHRQF